MSKPGEDKPSNSTFKEATPGQPSSQNVSRSNTSTPGPAKVFGNQAKKQEEVTRQGTHKLKFVPTLPVRRAKPVEVKQEEAPVAKVPPTMERGRGRGRGMGRGRGVAPPPRPELQMVASGPFAMGPSLAGSSGGKRAPRSNFTPVMPSGPSSIGGGLSNTAAPALSREKERDAAKVKPEDEDVKVYSDPDEGVQIVDMGAVKTMDWMAPESLRREKENTKKSKKKLDALKKDVKGKAKDQDDTEAEVVEAEVQKNLANALDLSDSEEEEEMEDLIEDFAQQMEDEDSLTRQEKLYFFQFPHPFPTFTALTDDTMDVELSPEEKSTAADKGKKVSFAENVKLPTEAEKDKSAIQPKIDGVIGQLEVHQSGMIKMRLNNGTLLDVTAATQPSFLQHAAYIDPETKKLFILGEVNRRFVVSPDTDKLIEEAEAAERIKAEASMDTT
ncbi:hypothetical protein M422DRAFT_63435 [Sphaerobolus stellatus SS14]|nr:hypothetical protein M422DRAFT_63435 [Sphaerobolus stellatus SS14]